MTPPSPPPPAILIVDDEPLIRLHLADFFADEGFEVFEAENAEQAIAAMEAHSGIRIVLTDVQMPGSMDGVMLAHYIRDRWPPTVLVVASGAVALEEGALPSRAAFVSKPFDPRFVLGEIERLSL